MKHLVRIALFVLAGCVLSACGGGRGGSGSAGATVTVSGTITFDRVPFKALPQQGLDFASTAPAPARNIVVEGIDASSGAILATTTTDAAGVYSLSAPANRNIFIRVKALMLKVGTAPTWDFRVLNNTNGDALYTLDGAAFATTSGNIARNLHAASGWNGATYVAGARSAAPFAILDTVYRAKELVIAAKADVSFPALKLFWSEQNVSSKPFCPDTGSIASTLYADSPGDSCTPDGQAPAGIYIQGFYSASGSDPDEFDQHVIAHEFGHYLEHKFSRTDSIGGEHSFINRLDLRVAMSEGWGDAFSGMVMNDPVYRDSAFQSGVSYDGVRIDLEGHLNSVPGWYSEVSAAKILWDVFDTSADAGDTLNLGFGSVFSALQGKQFTTDALTSIYSFADALKIENPASGAALNNLLASNGVNASAEFAVGESNDGGDASVLPVYRDLTLNVGPVAVCSTGTSDGFNKLGNRKFMKVTLAVPSQVTITAIGAVDPGTSGSVAATDPDIYVWRKGAFDFSNDPPPAPPAINDRKETLSGSYPAGTYIIEVFDSAFVEQLSTNPSSPHCMTVAVGAT